MWPDWVCGNQWLDIFLHPSWGQLWWVLTNFINFLILLLPLEVHLFHPLPISNALLLLGMVFVIPLQRFHYLLSFLLELWFQWKFYLVQTELYSFNNSVSFLSKCCFSLWWGGLNVSGTTFSAIILSVVILCIIGASGFPGDCGFSSSISSIDGSRWPTYSPLLNLISLLV